MNKNMRNICKVPHLRERILEKLTNYLEVMEAGEIGSDEMISEYILDDARDRYDHKIITAKFRDDFDKCRKVFIKTGFPNDMIITTFVSMWYDKNDANEDFIRLCDQYRVKFISDLYSRVQVTMLKTDASNVQSVGFIWAEQLCLTLATYAQYMAVYSAFVSDEELKAYEGVQCAVGELLTKTK